MTLQSSGPISLANVQTEFGGTNPIGINEYYGAAAGVPASGTISLNDFYGKSAGFVWTQYYLGETFELDGILNYDGLIKTPGSDASPVTYGIELIVPSAMEGGGSSTLKYYVGGVLTQTWSSTSPGTTLYTYTSTFGSSSIQFRCTLIDNGSMGDSTVARAKVGGVIVFDAECNIPP
jgi:hypothetical protein